ncbi:MAG: rhomboid family intramembrane serine protease, partial [Pedosphaera parvula]|nr:rhomboid family intramembrane serine protease [Pedosphaera parvula]
MRWKFSVRFGRVCGIGALVEYTPANPAPESVLIPVRSRSQAMDWSLALASQGIAATITHDPEQDRWSLMVDAPDSQQAFATLKQYHLENRGWRWAQPLPWAGTMFHWGSLLWCLFLWVVHGLVLSGGANLREAGVMDNVAFRNGEGWRLFTAVTLHADWSHLVSNLTTGFLLFGLAMARYGAGMGLLAAFLAGVGGNLAGALLYARPYQGLGASGMVMGALGLLAGGAISQWRAHPFSRKQVLAGLAAGLMLFLLFGADPHSDTLAHLGGFV